VSQSSLDSEKRAPYTSRYWHEWSSTALAKADTQKFVAILPIGACEQHGAHLPLGTDSLILEALLAQCLKALAPEIPVLCLPTLALGWSLEHQSFPGTLSLRPTTLLAVLQDIGDSLAASGVRRLLLLNGHGGQGEILRIAARQLRAQHQMLVVASHWQEGYLERLASLGAAFNAHPNPSCEEKLPQGVLPADERKYGLHGGAFETALIAEYFPKLYWPATEGEVFTSLSQKMQQEGYQKLSPQGRYGFAWLAQDLNPAGVVGDPSLASPELAAHIAAATRGFLCELLAEMSRFSLNALKLTPPPTY
jgi:creatinine amidohydrolase